MGHGTFQGSIDFIPCLGAVFFFHLLERKSTRPIQEIKRWLIFHGVEVAVVGSWLSMDTWINGETGVSFLAIWLAAVSYVAVIVAGKDLIWWLERKGKRTGVKG
jgi:hypothetical protein